MNQTLMIVIFPAILVALCLRMKPNYTEDELLEIRQNSSARKELGTLFMTLGLFMLFSGLLQLLNYIIFNIPPVIRTEVAKYSPQSFVYDKEAYHLLFGMIFLGIFLFPISFIQALSGRTI